MTMTGAMHMSFVMMVGLPGSGKTHWIRQKAMHFNQGSRKTVVASSDNYIDLVAMEKMKTYNEVFEETIKEATQYCLDLVKSAVESRSHIIWDQTNLTMDSRKSKLALIPGDYFKKCVVVHCPDPAEWKHRLDGRPGKKIPDDVLTKMAKRFETPTKEEGFDAVDFVFA